MKEFDNWTDIKGFEGLYQINKNGDMKVRWFKCQ